MAAGFGKTASDSIGIPGRNTGQLLGEDDNTLFNTPKLSPSSVLTLEGTEKLGIPLKTRWTFWYDRSVKTKTKLLLLTCKRSIHAKLLK